ncbi:periplasmic heavy metal sensor [Variovorax terrae]|uniref:Periplasmic heavy metal sensor n=1 Tax=Variovorax terrae TaxID=2923278 RepID=A0A9X1VWH9_9BURK|nr:periplasmic heavy metal sensor [Variovorax terrae]MCJ0764488.1 periplasmic heavy metal sensor [Variovorax terrae]
MNEPALKRGLVVSLVVNLFLVCSIAGGAWRWWASERAATAAAMAAQPRGLRFAADELSADQRRAFRVGLRDARRDAAPSLQAARDGRQEVLRLLGAPELDRAAVADALARTREADKALRARVETSVVDFAATLSPEDRQKLVSGLTRRSTLGLLPPAQPKP